MTETAAPTDGIVLAQADVSAPDTGGATAAPSGSGLNAVNDCLITAEDDSIQAVVTANDIDSAAGMTMVAGVSEPQNGSATMTEDGLITYRPNPGFTGEDRFSYTATDGAGAEDTAEVFVMVNPLEVGATQIGQAGWLNQPSDWGALASACAGGTALDVAQLAGGTVSVPAPDAGQRIEVAVQPGQIINLADPAFADARFLPVEGGVLAMLEDGRVVFMRDLVEAAEGNQPPVLRIADGQPVSADLLLAALDDQGTVSPAAPGTQQTGPQAPDDGQSDAGGGAGFSPFNPGALGPALDQTGPLGPTALAFGLPDGEEDSDLLSALGDDDGGPGGPDDDGEPEGPGDDGDPGDGDPGDGDPGDPGGPEPTTLAPTVDAIDGGIDLLPKEFTDSFQPTSTPALPTLQEGVAQIDPNGVDQGNLTIGALPDGVDGREVTIEFVSESALLQNSLGWYILDENGEPVPQGILFDTIDGSDPTGVNAISPGETRSLGTLPESTQFGFFLVQNGALFAPLLDEGATDLEFRPDENGNRDLFFRPDGDGNITAINGRYILFTDDAFNEDGTEQVISGFDPAGGGGFVIAYEDIVPGQTETLPFTLRGQDGTQFTVVSDRDFNDAVFEVNIDSVQNTNDLVCLTGSLDGVDLSDGDSETLAAASLEITQGRPGDCLEFGSFTIAADGELIGPAGAPTGVVVTRVDDASFTFSGEASIATYEAILGDVVFKTVEGTLDELDGDRVFSISVTDPDGNVGSGEATITPTLLEPSGGTDGRDVGGGDLGFTSTGGGSDGKDFFNGRDGNDVLNARSGDDFVDGGRGDDDIFGSFGDDILIGGPGDDILDGGEGADTFAFRSVLDGVDTILFFNAFAGDRLDIGELVDDGFEPGVNTDEFVSFTERDNGDIEVAVDQDGAGAASDFIAIAVLQNAIQVSAASEELSQAVV